MTPPGDSRSALASDADLRTDVPRYRVYRAGKPTEERLDVRDLWTDDIVAVLLGCSFTFEHALMAAGIRLRHVEQGRNVAMYRTSVPCAAAGLFAGPLVVSMRPIRADLLARVEGICARLEEAHGPPVAVGDPGRLGIRDLTSPDFGDAVEIAAGEEPVFWACGVTASLAAVSAQPPLVITHAPGHMFVTDRRIDLGLADSAT